MPEGMGSSDGGESESLKISQSTPLLGFQKTADEKVETACPEVALDVVIDDTPRMAENRAECRICQEEDEVGSLDVPCACSGSVKVKYLTRLASALSMSCMWPAGF